MIPQISSVAVVLVLQLSRNVTPKSETPGWVVYGSLACKDAHWRFLNLDFVNISNCIGLTLLFPDVISFIQRVTCPCPLLLLSSINSIVRLWTTGTRWHLAIDMIERNPIDSKSATHQTWSGWHWEMQFILFHKLSCKHLWTAATHGIQLR